MFENFCAEWIATSAWIKLLAEGIREGKAIKLIVDEKQAIRRETWQVVLSTINPDAGEDVLLTPYSLEFLDKNYWRTIPGTMSPEEDAQLCEAMSEEMTSWRLFVSAVVAAHPDLASEARDAFATYTEVSRMALAYYRGKWKGANATVLYDLACPLEEFLANVAQAELKRYGEKGAPEELEVTL